MSINSNKNEELNHCENCSKGMAGLQVLCNFCDAEDRQWCEECCFAEINEEIDLERKWREGQLRYTDTNYLRIFPEVKELIPAKLEELDQRKSEKAETVKSRLVALQAVKGEFARWFWREWLKIDLVSELLELENQIQRFKRFKYISEGKDSGNLSEAIQRALQVSILDVSPINFRKVGRSFVALCPFHSEKTPSFNVFRKNGEERFYCFGCFSSGDVIDFVQHYRNCSFKEALRELTGEKI